MCKPYKVVCLDYYGTLVKIEQPFESIRKWIVDEVGDTFHIYSHMLRGYAKISTEIKYMRGEDKLVRSLRYACEKWNVDVDYSKFRDFLSSLFGDASAYSDAYDAISMLRRKYIVGVASNADNHIITASIVKNNFEFDFVITSEDAQVEKPAPMFFLYALNKLGVSREDVIWVGDSWNDDIIGAYQSSIDCIWINRGGKKLQNSDIALKANVCSLAEVVTILEADDSV